MQGLSALAATVLLLLVLTKLQQLSRKHGIKIILLSYANPQDRRMIERICSIKNRLAPSLPLYIATIDLQHPGTCNPCSTTGGKAETPASPKGLKAKPAIAPAFTAVVLVALLAAAAARLLKTRAKPQL